MLHLSNLEVEPGQHTTVASGPAHRAHSFLQCKLYIFFFLGSRRASADAADAAEETEQDWPVDEAEVARLRQEVEQAEAILEQLKRKAQLAEQGYSS